MLRAYDEFALPHLEIPSNILFGKVSQTSIERTGLSEIKIGIHINQASGLGSDYNFDLYARLVENCIVWLAVFIMHIVGTKGPGNSGVILPHQKVFRIRGKWIELDIYPTAFRNSYILESAGE